MKKYLFGILAVLFAIAFAAFTPVRNTKNQGEFQWFQLKDGKTYEDRLNPFAYQPADMPVCESASGVLCSIYAEGGYWPNIEDLIRYLLLIYKEGMPIEGFIAERDE